ncbi:MAG: hypothetical protein ACI8SZ_002515, partial [Colwellia sp.]
ELSAPQILTKNNVVNVKILFKETFIPEPLSI